MNGQNLAPINLVFQTRTSLVLRNVFNFRRQSTVFHSFNTRRPGFVCCIEIVIGRTSQGCHQRYLLSVVILNFPQNQIYQFNCSRTQEFPKSNRNLSPDWNSQRSKMSNSFLSINNRLMSSYKFLADIFLKCKKVFNIKFLKYLHRIRMFGESGRRKFP